MRAGAGDSDTKDTEGIIEPRVSVITEVGFYTSDELGAISRLTILTGGEVHAGIGRWIQGLGVEASFDIKYRVKGRVNVGRNISIPDVWVGLSLPIGLKAIQLKWPVPLDQITSEDLKVSILHSSKSTNIHSHHGVPIVRMGPTQCVGIPHRDLICDHVNVLGQFCLGFFFKCPWISSMFDTGCGVLKPINNMLFFLDTPGIMIHISDHIEHMLTIVGQLQGTKVANNTRISVIGALTGICGDPGAPDAHDELVLVDTIAILITLKLILVAMRNRERQHVIGGYPALLIVPARRIDPCASRGPQAGLIRQERVGHSSQSAGARFIYKRLAINE